MASSKKTPLVVKEFAQIEKTQGVIVCSPKYFLCCRKRELKKTDFHFTYDKYTYYFEGDKICCLLEYINKDGDPNVSSIDGVPLPLRIHPLHFTVQF